MNRHSRPGWTLLGLLIAGALTLASAPILSGCATAPSEEEPSPAPQPRPTLTKEDKQLAEATELHREVVRLGNAGKHRDAVALARKALEIRTSILGEEHPDTAASLNDLGVLYRSLSDYATAEPLFIQALKIREKVLKPDHPDLAVTLNELGLLYKSVGDYAKAEPFYRPRKGDRSIYAVL